MDTTCQVWVRGEFLGRVTICHEDWRNVSNWRGAAIAAARRMFGPGRPYHVTVDGPILD